MAGILFVFLLVTGMVGSFIDAGKIFSILFKSQKKCFSSSFKAVTVVIQS